MGTRIVIMALGLLLISGCACMCPNTRHAFAWPAGNGCIGTDANNPALDCHNAVISTETFRAFYGKDGHTVAW